ncbi:lasso RiPP family leader peptide-containing protein [Pseudofrankia asymbiotica]|uniref:lasso RiPP family leader peptide-containing protein n=1 Tax=Pseudofrankia asymbiotica TaxID=1834516 RepID=UPI000E2F3767|nr:lasso RiPP family leader peptide-containing protein [Pseudofrankia asymbiotica]
MKACYETPALDGAGSFAEVTGGRWGWGRDWLWRSFWGGGPGGGGGVIIIGGGGGGWGW